jgi:phosphate transport system permease protein
MLVELVTNETPIKNIKMSTENKLAKKKEEVKKLPLDFYRYKLCYCTSICNAFIVVKGIGVISWEFISEMPKWND